MWVKFEDLRRWVVFFDPSLWRISQSSLRKPGSIDAFTVSWFIRSSSGQLRTKDWYVDECFTAISRIIVCSQPELHCGFTVLSVFWRFKPWRHLGDPLLVIGSSWSLQGVPYRCSFHEMSCFVFPLPNRVQKDFGPLESSRAEPYASVSDLLGVFKNKGLKISIVWCLWKTDGFAGKLFMFGHFGTNDEKPKAPYALVVVHLNHVDLACLPLIYLGQLSGNMWRKSRGAFRHW